MITVMLMMRMKMIMMTNQNVAIQTLPNIIIIKENWLQKPGVPSELYLLNIVIVMVMVTEHWSVSSEKFSFKAFG